MLPWISPFRNTILLAALGACFVLATLAFLLSDPQPVRGPAERPATASSQGDRDAAAIFARQWLLLDAPVQSAPPTLKAILDSAQVLAEAGLIARFPEPPIPSVAAAAVTPTNTPVPAPAAAPAIQRQPVAPSAPVVPPAPAQPQAPPPPPVSAPSVPSGLVRQALGVSIDAAFTQGVLEAVNAVRARAGLQTLRPDGALTSAANAYADTLADARWFSHTGPDGSTMGDRLYAAGVVNVAAGEVLAMGWDGWTPDAVAQAWLDSPAHRAIILGAFTRAGVACAFSQEDGSVVVRCVMELAG